MFKNILLLVSFFISLSTAKSQTKVVDYKIEPKVEEVLVKHYEAWLNITKIEGYRIQIGALSGTNSRNAAQELNEEFVKAFPEVPCYLSYAEPNFRVRVGNFETRLEALHFLVSIQQLFPGAFIVKDKIVFTDF